MAISGLYALVLVAPETARLQILDAYATAHGNRDQAAKTLGVHFTTLNRLVNQLHLKPEIWRRHGDQIRASNLPKWLRPAEQNQ